MMNLGSSEVEVLNPSDIEVVVDSQKSLRIKSRKTKKLEVRKMAIIGVLAAISIMLSMQHYIISTFQKKEIFYKIIPFKNSSYFLRHFC